MIGYLIYRLLNALAVLFGVVSVTFILLHLAGDPLTGLIPPGAGPEVEAQIRAEFGLDRSLPTQYVDFVSHAMRGDFGDSWRQGRPALEAVVERLPATLALTATATALALCVGGFLGVVAAARPGSLWDFAARLGALLGQAVPAFWLGTMLILLLAVDLQWVPASGLQGPGGVVLPALALAAYPAATLTRLLRAALVESLGADYIRTARAKGLSRTRILVGHALRNAVLPALAFTGIQVGFLLGGAVIIEGVFAFPGIGGLALAAVASRDIPLVEAFVWVVAVMILIVNALTDLIALILDPRLRDEGLAVESAAS